VSNIIINGASFPADASKVLLKSTPKTPALLLTMLILAKDDDDAVATAAAADITSDFVGIYAR
jgi:hypothetical protein